MTKNSSSSRARKTGAQLRDNPEEREKCGKTAKSPFDAVTHAESVSVSVAAGLSADSGDKLNLRHLQLRDTVAARSQGRPNLVDELQQLGHRPPCQRNATAEPVFCTV